MRCESVAPGFGRDGFVAPTLGAHACDPLAGFGHVILFGRFDVRIQRVCVTAQPLASRMHQSIIRSGHALDATM